jgi:hypothetical protein
VRLVHASPLLSEDSVICMTGRPGNARSKAMNCTFLDLAINGYYISILHFCKLLFNQLTP